MTHIPYKWNLPDPVPEAISIDLDAFSLPFRSVLYRRGCTCSEDAISFLLPTEPSYPIDLELGHLDLARKLIEDTIKSEGNIAIVGDYDVDGITATAILTLALNRITPLVFPFIPNRLTDGYGLKKPIIDTLEKENIHLLITVDNGIRSVEETAYAKSLGIKVIITDHHEPANPLPDADAIVNPKLPGDPYPNKNLAGVGVVYKLVCKLVEVFPVIQPEDYLDLVALGTIADIVPLLGENRYLVKQGLIQINQHRRQSLLSLIGAAGLQHQNISASDISFQIAPRVNSSSRLSDANHLTPLELFLSSDPAVCGKQAQILEIHNERRKQLSRKMQNRIESQFAAQDKLPPVLISLDPENDPGVAGIAAGHLTRKYYLPAIVGTVTEDTTTASCRSIPEFDIIASLNEISDLFTHYGGHKLAAGFTLDNEFLPEFCDSMTDMAKMKLSGVELGATLDIDAVIPLSSLTPSLYQELTKLEPTGAGNQRPTFVTWNVNSGQVSKVGKHGDHLKFMVDDGNKTMPAIAFGLGSIANDLTSVVDIAYQFNRNEFRGKKEYQLQILDIKLR